MLPDARSLAPADRRRDRTTEALSALTRLLETARRRSGLEALAVAEAGGVLLAGAGPARLCDEMAAWAPLVDERAANDAVPSRLDVFERRALVQRLAVDGVEIIVCGVGDGEKTRRELGAVAAGCSRILAPRG
ncbi:MAG TPA: hypothetical protein VF103_11145 [Polyangiaceae bacterium]